MTGCFFIERLVQIFSKVFQHNSSHEAIECTFTIFLDGYEGKVAMMIFAWTFCSDCDTAFREPSTIFGLLINNSSQHIASFGIHCLPGIFNEECHQLLFDAEYTVEGVLDGRCQIVAYVKILEELISIIINQALSLVFDGSCYLLIVGVNSLDMNVMVNTYDTNNYFITFFVGSQFALNGFVLHSGLWENEVLCKLVHVNHTIGQTLLELLIRGSSKRNTNTCIKRVGTSCDELFRINLILIGEHEHIIG